MPQGFTEEYEEGSFRVAPLHLPSHPKLSSGGRFSLVKASKSISIDQIHPSIFSCFLGHFRHFLPIFALFWPISARFYKSRQKTKIALIPGLLLNALP